MLINIGIFLSFFAMSSGVISLYFENKINDQEFKLSKTQEDLFYNKIEEEFIQRLINLMKRDLDDTEQDLFINEMLVQNSFFSRAISKNDIFKMEESPEGYAFFTKESFSFFDSKLDNFMNLNILPKKKLTILKQVLKKKEEDFEIIKKNYQDLTLEEGLSIYDTTYEDYLNEINSGYSNQIKNDKNNVLEKYDFTYNFLRNMNKYFEFYLISSRDMSNFYYSEMDKINKKIKKYSNYEKKSISIAFILQLLVFIIIQFFEIGALRRKIYEKKK